VFIGGYTEIRRMTRVDKCDHAVGTVVVFDVHVAASNIRS